MTETKPKRRWFRFSIRDLLLVTAIVALSIGWWVDHRQLKKDCMLTSLLSTDSKMVLLQWEMPELVFASSVQTATPGKTAYNARIADCQKRIDERRDELMRELR